MHWSGNQVLAERVRLQNFCLDFIVPRKAAYLLTELDITELGLVKCA